MFDNTGEDKIPTIHCHEINSLLCRQDKVHRKFGKKKKKLSVNLRGSDGKSDTRRKKHRKNQRGFMKWRKYSLPLERYVEFA